MEQWGHYGQHHSCGRGPLLGDGHYDGRLRGTLGRYCSYRDATAGYLGYHPGPAGALTSSATSSQGYRGGTAIPGVAGATYIVTLPTGNGNYTVVEPSATGCASAPAAVAVVITGTASGSLPAGCK